MLGECRFSPQKFGAILSAGTQAVQIRRNPERSNRTKERGVFLEFFAIMITNFMGIGHGQQ